MSRESKRGAAVSAPARLPAWLPFAAGIVVLAGLIGAFAFWPRSHIGDAASAATRPPGLIVQVETLYNDIYLYKDARGYFELQFGAPRLRYVESVVNPKDPLELPVPYTQAMTAGLAYAENLNSAAIIGLGGGRTAWYHHKSVPDLQFTAVELDPDVATIAANYFDVKPERNFEVAIQDGRVWLTRTDKKFDIILVDAYRGPFVPFHLLTTEFYRLVAQHLTPGGVAVQNVEPSTMLFDSAAATIASVFEHMVFLQLPGDGNIVIVAYNGPVRDDATLQRVAKERTAQYKLRYDLARILARRYAPDWNRSTKPLTDDFAPVEFLKAIERHNAKQT
jgi:spermidine synthase